MTIVLREEPLRSEPGETLDPQNWDELRAQGHRMLDDMFDYIANIRERPVWSPIPDDIRSRFRSELPRRSSDVVQRHSGRVVARGDRSCRRLDGRHADRGSGPVHSLRAERLARRFDADETGRESFRRVPATG